MAHHFEVLLAISWRFGGAFRHVILTKQEIYHEKKQFSFDTIKRTSDRQPLLVYGAEYT